METQTSDLLVPFAPAEQARCQLLELPPEIRNIIYEFTLTVQPSKDGTVTISKTPQTGSCKSTVLGVLQTCHQIRNEAQTIFYHANQLRCYYHNLGDVEICNRVHFNFLGTIQPIRRDTIRSMAIIVSNAREAATAATKLQTLRALTMLRFDIDGAQSAEMVYCSFLLFEKELIIVLKKMKRLETVALKLPKQFKSSVIRHPMTYEQVEMVLKGIEVKIQEQLRQRQQPQGMKAQGS